ncbi:MAG: hypothetical protein SGARI_004262, partial [Bacillariaceae sp.]
MPPAPSSSTRGGSSSSSSREAFLKIAPDRVFSNDEIEQMIVNVKALSLEEQTKIVQDIHQIPDVAESNVTARASPVIDQQNPQQQQAESPEFVAEKLAEMQDCLQYQISDKKLKETFQMALDIDAGYVNDPEYRT